ncbi:PspA/IM30 family protein [Bacteriovoracaceae bacterium]|nr:PspA/IM30 family protein [Bacteriovoracaceae bacterium]
MSLFTRLFRWGKSEANTALDRLEDPVKMTEQGIRDLKKDLDGALKSLAEVKALAIRAKRDSQEKMQIAQDYEKKAMLLISKGQSGEIVAADADRLAGEALQKKEQLSSQATSFAKNHQQQEVMMNKLEGTVKSLRSQIGTWETELQTLKARSKVATASKKLNQQLAQTDSNGTIAMLQKMKDRVSEEEALAESYGEIAGAATSVDDEINRALAGSTTSIPASDSLLALKSKMGIK